MRLPRTINITPTIRQDRIMHKLLDWVRRARIANNPKRVLHFSNRYARFEQLGWTALP
jgi:hypothetical protein